LYIEHEFRKNRHNASYTLLRVEKEFIFIFYIFIGQYGCDWKLDIWTPTR